MSDLVSRYLSVSLFVFLDSVSPSRDNNNAFLGSRVAFILTKSLHDQTMSVFLSNPVDQRLLRCQLLPDDLIANPVSSCPPRCSS